MNDRFMFRGITKGKVNEFIYGSLLWYAGEPQIWDKDGKNYIVKHETVQQCTGLKDKNGKLIYEGDILQQPQLPHKVVCEWYKDGFWLNGFMNGAKRELRNMHNWYEVIGNIYENKELLESEG